MTLNLSRLFTRLLLLTMISIFSVTSQAASIWKVSKGKEQLLIGGTIHILSKDDFPLPKEYDKAFNQAQMLVFETDMAALEDPAFQQLMLQKLMLKDGTKLSDTLTPATYNKLKTWVEGAGLSMAMLDGFKPQMATLTVTMLAMKKMGMTEEGVDAVYYRKASESKKRLGQLETAEQQANFLARMGKGKEDEMILSTLQEMESLPHDVQKMRSSWREGDLQGMYDILLKPMVEEFPALYQMILVDRNNAWMPQLEKMAKTPTLEFVLVGGLHLVGKDGVLAQFKRKGYTVEKFK